MRFVVMGLVAVLGCADLGRPVDTAPAGTIAGTITYAESTTRALVVEAWDALPATGAPLASATIEGPVFPQPYALQGVAPGAVFLTARLAEADGAPVVLGSYRSVLEVTAVLLDEGVGLRGADFALTHEGSGPRATVVQGETRTLAGTVRFEGTVQPGDVLRGALYASYPARGAPADFQIVNINTPTFPWSFRFSDVRDGNYYTVFYLDRHGDSPFGPGYDDVVAWALGPDGRPLSTTIALGASRTDLDVVIGAR